MKAIVRIEIEDSEDGTKWTQLVYQYTHGEVEQLRDYLKMVDEASHKAQVELSKRLEAK